MSKSKKASRPFVKGLQFFLLAACVAIVFYLFAWGSISFIHQKLNPDADQAQESSFYSKQDFIQRLAPLAENNYRTHHILPSISLGQAILESDWGRSDLARQNHNLYGVKGGESDPLFVTQEYVDGEYVQVEEPFRQYASYEESMQDHADLLLKGPSHQPDLYHDVVYASDYFQAAQALQEAGYATDPDYARKLIDVIEDYKLYEYDDI